MNGHPIDNPATYDATNGTIQGGVRLERRLSELKGIWVDGDAYRETLLSGDPLVYSVETIEPAYGEGALHYGVGRIEPGRVGNEYFMTRGHLHEWRPAAEVYTALEGCGLMVLENEVTGDTRVVRFNANDIVYVPGYTAHRTINVGDVPLVYMGVYPAMAGHDYGAIAQRNFRLVIADVAGVPTVSARRTLQ